MSKLVNKNVVCESIVGCDCAIEIENSAATIRSIVNQNFDELVRRKLRRPTQRMVIESQNISFGSECVVSCSRWRVAIDAG